jgi:hypothetical protein
LPSCEYKPEGKPLTLAARVSVRPTVRSRGRPEAQKEEPEKKEGDDKAKADGAKDAKEEPAKEAKDTTEARPEVISPRTTSPRRRRAAPPAKPHGLGKVNVIVVADADLLNDQFWVDVRDFMGQQVAIPMPAMPPSWSARSTTSRAVFAPGGLGAEDRPFKLVNGCGARRAPLPRRSRRSPPSSRSRTSSPSSRRLASGSVI